MLQDNGTLATPNYRSSNSPVAYRRVFGGEPIEDLVHQIVAGSSGKDISIREVASLLCISPRTLSRKLRESGCTYGKLLRSVRRNKAFMLLKHTNLTVQEISTELGYKDASNFSRAFRLWTGLSPKTVRIQSRIEQNKCDSIVGNCESLVVSRWPT